MHKYIAIIISCVLIFICSLLAVSTYFSFSQNYPIGKTVHVTAVDEQNVVRSIVSSLTYYDSTHKEQIWPGYNPAAQPLIVTFDNGHIYAFNLNSQSPAWETLNVMNHDVQFAVTDYWGINQVQLQSDFVIDGIPAFVVHMDIQEKDPFAYLSSLLREKFRDYLQKKYKQYDLSTTHYKDLFNQENIILMQIEEMILADFMNSLSDSEKSHFHKETRLYDFLAVNITRRKLLKQSSIEWERKQQKLEGLAEYVAVKSLDTFPFIQPFNGVDYLLSILQASTVNEEILERTLKWRHEGVGAALAYALDFMEIPDWKQTLETTDLTQTDLLEQVLPLSDDEIQARMEKVKNRYNYDKVQYQVVTAMKLYEEEIQDLLEDYASLDGVEVYISTPSDQVSVEGGSSLYLYYLSDGGSLTIADTSKHSLKDDSWKLEMKAMPVVVQKEDGTIVVKLEDEAVVTIDGQSRPLKSFLSTNQTRTFQNLEIVSAHSVFASKARPGMLVIEDKAVKITYPNE